MGTGGRPTAQSAPSALTGSSDAEPLGATGVALGLAGAWASGGLLESRIRGIEPRDPTTLAVAALALLAAAVVQRWLPGRRAGRTDTLETLRMELGRSLAHRRIGTPSVASAPH